VSGLSPASLPVDLLLPGVKSPGAVPEHAAGVREAARQFESLFIGMMLKAMRDANAVFAEGSFLQSHEMALRQELLDQEWARHLAEHRGIGLAPVIERQMLSLGDRPAPAGSGEPMAVSPRTEGLPAPKVLSSIADQGAKALGFKAPAYPDAGAFVASLAPAMTGALAGTGLDVVDVLAQGALETGWGQHMIHRADGSNAHNLFGIKADERWQGDRVAVHTLEYRDGVARRQLEQFRAYPDVESAIRDYLDFLRGNPRYEAVFETGGERGAMRFPEALQRAGYATDPDYAGKLTRVAERVRGKLAL